MKKEKVKELFRKRSVKIGSVVLAAAIVFTGSMWAWKDSKTTVPELVTFVDTEGTVEIEGEEVPLAKPKVTKSTKTTKKTKKIKLKTASKKTYVQKGKSTTKKTTKTLKSGNTTTTTVTVKATDVKNQFKKGSKIKTEVTTEKTTVTKTVLSQQAVTSSTMTTAMANVTGDVSVASAAPQVDSRVSSAYNKLGFKITVTPSVSYSGLFDARSKTITMKRVDATIYHELGHFLAFVAGNYDMSAEFQGIFSREKSKYTAYNKAYVLSSVSEYFAESFKNYTLEPSVLRASRPETYKAMQTALSRVTDAQINNILTVYGPVWG